MPISTRRISLEEVAEHCEVSSCWVVVHNDVLDVTDFLDSHPGGMEILLEFAGGDATAAFDDCGHSMAARMLADKYKIGVLAEKDQRHNVYSPFIACAKKLVSLIPA